MRLVLGLFLLFAVGCSVSKNNEEKNESYSYQFNENGCDTGEIQNSSVNQLCDALKNDSLNGYCAPTLRFEHFQANCPGRSWN